MAVDLKLRASTARAAMAATAILFASVLHAQTAPTKPDPSKKPATTETKKPAPAGQFPYPGDPAPTPSTPSVTTDPSATPDAPAPAQKPKFFPYPGESAPSTTNPPDSPTPADDNSSSSSSSSSSSPADSNPDPDMPDAAPADAAKSSRHKLPKVQNLQTDEEREAEDLNVARFYRDRGNLNAAYQRSKDAVKHQPDDPDAHLLLAEVAQKLNKRDEAVAEYNALLKLDASDEQIKTARKALARLQ